MQEIDLLSALADPDHPWHRGWRELTLSGVPRWRRALRALRPGTKGQVAAIVQKTATLPGLRLNLDADAVAWWQHRLARSRLGDIAWLMPMTLFLAFLGLVAVNWLHPALGLAAVPGTGLVFAAAAAGAQALVVRPWLSLWFKWHSRAADARWWIAGLALLPWLGWAIPRTPVGLMTALAAAAALLAWQDGWLAAFPPKTSSPHNLGRIVLRRITLVLLPLFWAGLVVGAGLSTQRGLMWLAVSVPFAVAWYRGSSAMLLGLAKIQPGMRRVVLLLSLLFLTTVSVAAITQGNANLHFGSTLLITPLILFLAQGVVLEASEWRQRLRIPHRAIVVVELLLVIAWSAPR